MNILFQFSSYIVQENHDKRNFWGDFQLISHCLGAECCVQLLVDIYLTKHIHEMAWLGLWKCEIDRYNSALP